MSCRNNTLTYSTILASIFLALFADVKTLNLIVIAAYPSYSGVFMTAMYAVIIIGLLIIGLFLQRRSFLKLRKSHWGICIYVSCGI